MHDHENVAATRADGDRAPARKPAPPQPLHGLPGLQDTVGNTAVVQLLRQSGHAWAEGTDQDRSEDRHRHGPDCGHRQPERTAAPVQRSAVHDVLRAPGRPLDDATRTDMETRLGADFSDVRIHDDGAAKASAAEVGARAYTSGSHVVIGEGGGDGHTLAHELTHVIQQRQGPVAGTEDGSGLKVSDPSDRFEREAEATAKRVMSEAPSTVRRSAAHAGGRPSPEGTAQDSAPVQRAGNGTKRKERKEKRKDRALGAELRNVETDGAAVGSSEFEEFGNTHRNAAVDPDATGEEVGVHMAGARVEDAPIVDRFRHAFNQLESWCTHLRKESPDTYDAAAKKYDLEMRHRFTKEIKARTKQYKAAFRDLNNDLYAMEAEKVEFELFVEERADELRAQLGQLSQAYARPGSGTREIHDAVTEDDWRKTWHERITQVNIVIGSIWPEYEKQLDAWIQRNSHIRNKAPVGKLEYIGSLAKGYKGPPKQHVRYIPEDFDVDANLYAPALAEYAQRVDKLTPDRERVFGRNTTIKPLIAFADKVQKELVSRIEGIADDPSDLFDVAIHAPETIVQKEERELDEALYAVRAHGGRHFTELIGHLKEAGLLPKEPDVPAALPSEPNGRQKAALKKVVDTWADGKFRDESAFAALVRSL
ncbi:DUF4157 domain-containing protein [Streptomyces sp. NPDC041068]|uniref:eCIS core domain-containing protein n=1 Tax=Streptomyces sp. NPDC041068 TaxID=3155130 RepID=UPI0034019254